MLSWDTTESVTQCGKILTGLMHLCADGFVKSVI